MKALVGKPVNETQRVFNNLCVKGGGVKGGPARGKVLELLRDSGQALNKLATREMTDHLAAFPSANPWHICFGVGLSWGHLAKLDFGFTEAVVDVLANWNATDLKRAQAFHMERGPEPIAQSLTGAHILFGKVTLPAELPSTLNQLGRAQERWLSPILNPTERPPYIGAWNGTAMFMTALFAQPALAATHVSPPPMLPPGGPINVGLMLLHHAGILSRPPAGSDLDDAAFEPGAVYENNGLFAELCKQRSDWSLIDVHSGVYMLGTRHPHSDTWA
jgi:hypothetical protein